MAAATPTYEERLRAVCLTIFDRHGHGGKKRIAEEVGVSHGHARQFFCGATKSRALLDRIEAHLQKTEKASDLSDTDRALYAQDNPA